VVLEKQRLAMTKKAKQKAKRKKAFKRATCYSFLGAAMGCGLGIGLFMIAVSVTPSISPKQVADAVRSQVIHGTAINPALQISHPTYPSSDSNAIPTSTNNDGFVLISFEQLAGFRFAVTDRMLDSTKYPQAALAETADQIPATVRAFNDHFVSVKGFMLPMKFNGSLATDFLLMRNQSLCCYRMPPRITEWVNVRMAGKGVKPMVDEPVTVFGTFHVGEVRENGDLVGIYRLDGQKLTRN
jgi:hypothetical protein